MDIFFYYQAVPNIKSKLSHGIALSLWAVLLLLLSLSVDAKSTEKTVSLTEASHALELRSGEGYMLLKLEAAGPAPSIELEHIGGLSIKHDVKSGSRSRQRLKINLKDRADGFYVANLKEGTYQIVQVNVPYFGLPYWLDTDNRRIWRFSVKMGVVNYIGNLTIAQERSVDSVTAHLTNRLAMELPLISELIAKFPVKTTLRNGVGYRDDFLDALGRPSENGGG